MTGLNPIGNFQDSLNKVEGKNRKFVFNRGELDAKNMLWSADLMEIIEGGYVEEIEPVFILSGISMTFPSTAEGESSHQDTIITVYPGVFTINMDDATWADFKVYKSSVDVTANPLEWTTGSVIKIFPISANTGVEKNGTVHVTGAGSTIDISLLQQLHISLELSNTSMYFDDLADSYSDYQESEITITTGVFTVDMSDASWAEFRVYPGDGASDITSNPSLWNSGTLIRAFPVDSNNGPEKTGIIHISTTGASLDISISQQAAAATVNVRSGNFSVLMVTDASGIISSGIQIAFTPHYVPGGDPHFNVCWLIKINDVEAYSSAAVGIACSQDTPETMQHINTGSMTWNDGDVIDVYLYYELAPGLS